MAGRKLTVLPSLGGMPQPDDLGYVVDVSDTSESPQGTSKSFDFGDVLQAGTYTPTISDEVNGTATVFGDFLYTRIGDIVTVTGGFEFELDGGETDGSFKFDLGALIQPDNNWASATDPITLLSRASDFFDSECVIFGDVGSKLMDCALSDTTAGSNLKIFFSTTYKITN